MNALKKLEFIRKNHFPMNDVVKKYFDDIEIELKDKEKFENKIGMDLAMFSKAVNIKKLINDALKNEKEVQAFKIIKKYIVNVFDFIEECVAEDMSYPEYVENETWDYIQHSEGKPMDYEEYELLKEVLNNDKD